ncbi:MAG: D-alanine--D-alanine ligase family protein [Bacillota bacterium]|nr:D-alanine--D-alanine ligase family protein [Bacillota bacterium]
MPKTKLAVIYGSKSGEHEVSIVSASNVIAALDTNKYDIIRVFISKELEWFLDPKGDQSLLAPYNPMDLKKDVDFVLPILHGPNGEDGTVQGLLELLNIPYGGCSVIGCATAMDKIVAKEIFENAGLKQTPYVALTTADIEDASRKAEKLRQIKSKLKLPYFVKPANMGSSVGITKVKNLEDLDEALDIAAHYDSRIVVEQGVNCRELETGVIGNDVLEVATVGEIITGADFYTYDDKYIDGTSSTQIPANISEEAIEKIREMAKVAYASLGCCGFARVDFMMDKDSGEIFINEINAIPGFTNISMFPKLFMYQGYTYGEIIERIIELGYERYNAKNHR